MAMGHLETCEKELDLYLRKVECAKQTLIDAKNAIEKARLSIQQIPETVLTCNVQKLLLSILQQPEDEGSSQEDKQNITSELTNNNQQTVAPPQVEQSFVNNVPKDEKENMQIHHTKNEFVIQNTKSWKDLGKIFMKVASSLSRDGTFWCLPEYGVDKNQLRLISDKLKHDTMNNRDLWNCDSSKRDQIVCVLSKVHNLWLRGIIEKNSSESEVILRYIDLGKTEKVPKNRLNCIPESMNDLQPLMLLCCFQKSPMVASYEIKWKFNDLTKNKMFAVEIKEEIADGVLPRFLVSLRDRDNEADDIAEIICKEVEAQNPDTASALPSKDVRIYGNAPGNHGQLSIVQDVYNSKKKPEKDSRKEKDSGNEDEKSKTAGGEIEEAHSAQQDSSGKFSSNRSKPPTSPGSHKDQRQFSRQNSSGFEQPPRMHQPSLRRSKTDEQNREAESEAARERKNATNPPGQGEAVLRIKTNARNERESPSEPRELWSPTSPSAQRNANIRPIFHDGSSGTLPENMEERMKQKQQKDRNLAAQPKLTPEQTMLAHQQMQNQQQLQNQQVIYQKQEQQQQQQSYHQSSNQHQLSFHHQQQQQQVSHQQKILQQHQQQQQQYLPQNQGQFPQTQQQLPHQQIPRQDYHLPQPQQDLPQLQQQLPYLHPKLPWQQQQPPQQQQLLPQQQQLLQQHQQGQLQQHFATQVLQQPNRNLTDQEQQQLLLLYNATVQSHMQRMPQCQEGPPQLGLQHFLLQSQSPVGMPIHFGDSEQAARLMSSPFGTKTKGDANASRLASNLEDFGSGDEAERDLMRDCDIFGLDEDDL